VTPVRFNFDRSFDEDVAAREEAERRAWLAKVEEAREEGRREGGEAGHQQAHAEIEARIAALLEQVTEGIARLNGERAQLESALEAESARLAHAMASRLAPALMQRHPTAEIEALMSECLDGCRHEPRIVMRVAEDLVDSVAARIEPLKQAGNFMGDVVLVGDPTLSGQDCRVEWPDGGAERDYQALDREIVGAVERFIASTGTSALAQ